MLTDGTLPRGSTFREVSVSELTLPRLKAGEIHLFAVGLAPDRARIDAMAGLMGPAERERAARYRFTPPSPALCRSMGRRPVAPRAAPQMPADGGAVRSRTSWQARRERPPQSAFQPEPLR